MIRERRLLRGEKRKKKGGNMKGEGKRRQKDQQTELTMKPPEWNPLLVR